MDGHNLYGYLAMAFVFGVLVLIVILLVVILKLGHKTKHLAMMSTAEAASNAEYRKLAESSIQLQHEIKDGQGKLAAELAQLRTRVAAIEKLLREVE